MKQTISKILGSGCNHSWPVWLVVGSLFIFSHAPTIVGAQPASPADSKATNSKPSVAPSNPEPKLNLQLSPLGRETRNLSSYAPIVKRVEASVVTVYSTKRIKVDSRNPLAKDPMFRRFFGGPGGPGAPGGPGESPDEEEGEEEEGPSMGPGRPEQSLGSGVILTADGYIMSNSHVVEGADEVKVTLADGRTEYTAKVVGVDTATDISVLKVNATNLPAAAITDSTTLQVGDTVLAVGNPFGVGQTVTLGIVSAIGRGGFGITDYEDFIQTDASINPGNSGGALVDVEGRLVGIPTAILSRSGGNVGIGFAVPINMARNVMDMMVKHGRVVRGYLGVFVQTVTPSLKQAFKVPELNGALVSGVAPKSPAAAAGVKEGDVIAELNGKPVTDSRQLRLLIGANSPNSKIELTLWRDGQKKTVSTTLGELPTEKEVAKVEETLPPTGRRVDGKLGLELRNLDEKVARLLKLPATNGVLVEGVDRSSPAYSAGIRPGDVILEVNRKPVATAQEASELSKAPSEGQVLMKVWSRGGSRFVVVETGKKE